MINFVLSMVSILAYCNYSPSQKVPGIYECIGYIIHFALFFNTVRYAALEASEKCLGYYSCRRFIKESIFGYTIDTADSQWTEMRKSFSTFIAVALFIKLCRVVLKGKTSRGDENKSINNALDLQINCIVGLAFIFIQHSIQCIITVAVSLAGYIISEYTYRIKHRSIPYAIPWIYGILILLLKESYRIQYVAPYYSLQILFLKQYSGFYSWRFPVNFLVLRMISFSCDRVNDYKNHRHLKQKNHSSNHSNNQSASYSSSNIHSKTTSVPTGIHNDHVVRYSKSNYSIIKYLSYLFYAPLYVAGPIMSYEDYLSDYGYCISTTTCANSTSSYNGSDSDVAHIRATSRYSNIETASAGFNTSRIRPSNREIFVYALWWLVCLIMMEVLTHSVPVFAIVYSGLYVHLTVREIIVIGYLVLQVMWLKFTLIWRFFRLWSLLDGVHPPENMLRCMSNNYSLEQFWRGWHASFNQWIVRYLYKPLGGRDTQLLTVWPIFLFVSLWHDLELKLLLWGLLNSLFYGIEVFAKRLCGNRFLNHLTAVNYHATCVISGGLFIFVLAGVNLIGYSMGTQHLQFLYTKLSTETGVQALVATLYFLCWGVSFMLVVEKVKSSFASPNKPNQCIK